MRKGSSGLIGIFHFGGLSQVAAERIWFASRSVQETGYQILVNDASWSHGGVRAGCEAMLDARVEGVVVAGLNDPVGVKELKVLQKAKIPIVTLSGNELPGTPHIRGDASEAFRKVTAHLISMGRKRLLLLCTLTHRVELGAYIWAGLERLEGFRAAIHAAAGKEVKSYSSRDEVQGRVVNREFVPARFDPFQQAHDAVMQILDDSSRPDAIICTNDDWAIGALAALRKRGVSVPREVAVTGYDNTSVGTYLDVPLTTVSQPNAEMAEHAVVLLCRAIQKKRIPAGPIKFPGSLIVRKSCGFSDLHS